MAAEAIAECNAQGEIDDGLADGGDPGRKAPCRCRPVVKRKEHQEQADHVGDGEDFQEHDAVAGVIGPTQSERMGSP